MSNPVTIDDLYQLEFIGQLKGFQNDLVFVRGVCDEENNTYQKNLELCRDQRVSALTGPESSAGFVFTEDGRVWFTSSVPEKKEKGTGLYSISPQGGERVLEAFLEEEDLQLEGLAGEYLFVFSKQVDLLEEKPDYEVLDEDPWYMNAQGFINKKRDHFWYWNRNTSVLQNFPMPDNLIAGQRKICGMRLVFTASKASPKPDLTDGLYAWNFSTESMELLIPQGTYSIHAVEPAQEGVWFFAQENPADNLNANPALYWYAYADRSITKQSPRTFSVGNTIGCDVAVIGGNATLLHEGTLYFTATEVDHNTLYCWRDGEYQEVFSWPGSIHSFAFAAGSLWFTGAAPNEPGQLYEIVPTEEGHHEAVCRSEFNFFLQDRYVAHTVPVVFAGYEGKPQTGWVLYPRDFDENRSYPGILDIHGGPKTVYGQVFYHEMQVWASRGYFVFFCNPYGSDGQGDDYSDMRGRYGSQDYEDLMHFTDAVLAQVPQLDADRLCVTGGSYGGFMTNWIIGHTDRFKAAASQRSISNWISFFGTSDIGPYFTRDQIGCGLENPEQLWDRSPLKYADRAVTPTLFIHSDEDYRCPLEQGLQMMHRLMDCGTETRMCLFHGENHELSRSGRPQHRVRRLHEITEWMDQHARK